MVYYLIVDLYDLRLNQKYHDLSKICPEKKSLSRVPRPKEDGKGTTTKSNQPETYQRFFRIFAAHSPKSSPVVKR